MGATCPICGAQLPDDVVKDEYLFEGTVFRFCSPECLKVFRVFPEAYGRGQEPDLKALEDTAF